MDTLGLSLSALLSSGAGPLPGYGAQLFTSGNDQESSPDATSGTSHFSLPSGMVYKGATQRGVLSGQGELAYSDGTVYEGEFSGGLPHGNGRILWSDGSVYEGGMAKGARSGVGSMRHVSSGSVYQGEWLDGLKHGKGVQSYGCQAVYEGGWVRGERSGRGELRHKEGNRYVGEWEKDQKHGCGWYLWESGPNAGQEYVGSWASGVPHGWGVHTWFSPLSSTSTTSLTQPTGRAIVCRYKGQFVYGRREGVGCMAYASGGVYWGGWERDEKSGYGVWAAADGSVFDAGFQHDSPMVTLAGLVGEGAALSPSNRDESGKSESPRYSTSASQQRAAFSQHPLSSPVSSLSYATPTLPIGWAAAALPPGVHPQSSLSSRFTTRCDTLHSLTLRDLAPPESAMLTWMERQTALAAAAQLSVLLPSTAKSHRGGKALGERLRGQCESRLASVLLKWNGRITAWFETYAKLPMPDPWGVGVGPVASPNPTSNAVEEVCDDEMFARAPSVSDALSSPSHLDLYLKQLAVSMPSTSQHSLRLGQLWAFCRDCGLLSPPDITLATVGELLGVVRLKHARRVVEAVGRVIAMEEHWVPPKSGGAGNPSLPSSAVEVAAGVLSLHRYGVKASTGADVGELPSVLEANAAHMTAPARLSLGSFPPPSSHLLPCKNLHPLQSPFTPVLFREFAEVLVRLILLRKRDGDEEKEVEEEEEQQVDGVGGHPIPSPLPSSPLGLRDGKESKEDPSSVTPSNLPLQVTAAAAAGNSLYATSSRSIASSTHKLPLNSAVKQLASRGPWGSGGRLTGGKGVGEMMSRSIGSGQYRGSFGNPLPCLFTTTSISMLCAPGEDTALSALRHGDPDGPSLLLDAALFHLVAPRALAPPPPTLLAPHPTLGGNSAPLPTVSLAMMNTVVAAVGSGGAARTMAVPEEREEEGAKCDAGASVALSVSSRRSLSGNPRRIKIDPDVAAAAAAASRPPLPLQVFDGLRVDGCPGFQLPSLPLDLSPASLQSQYTGGGGISPRSVLFSGTGAANSSGALHSASTLSAPLKVNGGGKGHGGVSFRFSADVEDGSDQERALPWAPKLNKGGFKGPNPTAMHAASEASPELLLSRALMGGELGVQLLQVNRLFPGPSPTTTSSLSFPPLQMAASKLSAALAMLPLPLSQGLSSCPPVHSSASFGYSGLPEIRGLFTFLPVESSLEEHFSPGSPLDSVLEVPPFLPLPPVEGSSSIPPTDGDGKTTGLKGDPSTLPATDLALAPPKKLSSSALGVLLQLPQLEKLRSALLAALSQLPVFDSHMVARLAFSALYASPPDIPSLVATRSVLPEDKETLKDWRDAFAAMLQFSDGVDDTVNLVVKSSSESSLLDTFETIEPISALSRAEGTSLNSSSASSSLHHTASYPLEQVLATKLTPPELNEALLRVSAGYGLILQQRRRSLSVVLAEIASAGAAALSSLDPKGLGGGRNSSLASQKSSTFPSSAPHLQSSGGVLKEGGGVLPQGTLSSTSSPEALIEAANFARDFIVPRAVARATAVARLIASKSMFGCDPPGVIFVDGGGMGGSDKEGERVEKDNPGRQEWRYVGPGMARLPSNLVAVGPGEKLAHPATAALAVLPTFCKRIV